MVNIGDFRISFVNDLIGVKRDPSFVYPHVNKKDWEKYKSFAQNPDGTIQSTWRGYLLEYKEKKILIDTGMGPGPYDHDKSGGKFIENLNKLGIEQSEIDFVFITHTHGDHIGWNINWETSEPKLNFPNAKYLISKFDYEYYSDINKEIDPIFKKQILPLNDLGALRLIEGREEILPNIFSLPANGHTPGHQCLLLENINGENIVFTGDLFHNEAQIFEKYWCPVFDWNTTMSTISRLGILNLAEENNWIICTGHLSDSKAIGKIVSKNNKITWEPILK
jgi:glyoxylase-like metal-dependent hydrolase (beta-lactamase superfamily II)